MYCSIRPYDHAVRAVQITDLSRLRFDCLMFESIMVSSSCATTRSAPIQTICSEPLTLARSAKGDGGGGDYSDSSIMQAPNGPVNHPTSGLMAITTTVVAVYVIAGNHQKFELKSTLNSHITPDRQ